MTYVRSFGTAMICVALVGCGQTAVPVSGPTRPAPPVFGKFDPATTQSIDVAKQPVLPEISAQMRANLRAIYVDGQKKGNNSRIFSKLGDCMTENAFFMGPLSNAQFELGEYASLKPVIERFLSVPTRAASGKAWQEDSFKTVGLASAGGYNVAGPLDPTWTNPQWCDPNESPLTCEYRVSKPAFAIIMFGTNDVPVTDLPTFDFYLRTTVSSTIDAGVIPILNTFPTRPEDTTKSNQLNQIVVKIAQDYNVPLINLNRALAALHNMGVDPNDTTHLSTPPDNRVDVFSKENLQFGFTVRNLVTLQALEAVIRAIGE